MKIPIDDNTLGYVISYESTMNIEYTFIPYESKYHDNLTYGQFKQKFNVKGRRAEVPNPKYFDEFQELAKNFKFKIPSN